MVSKIRKRANIEALINSKLGLRKFASTMIQNHDEASRLISHKMHDDISQVLAGLKIEIGLIQKELDHQNPGSNENLSQSINGVLNSIDNAIQNTVNFSSQIWPELLDILGLIPTLNNISLQFIKQNSIACQFITSLEEIEVERQKSIAIFRIVELALNNIIEHAKASEVTIKLDKEEDKFRLRIVDNGVGFNTRVSNETKWFGLIEMLHRASMVDADLNVYSLKPR